MKKTIVGMACCALITPLAFAKEIKQKKLTNAYIEQGVTVTGSTVTTVEGGTAASHQPAKLCSSTGTIREIPTATFSRVVVML